MPLSINGQMHGTFLNVSGGKFVNKKKEISASAATGRLKKIELFEDEYNGTKLNKVRIVLDDGDAEFIISFNEESWFAHGFFSRVKNIDKEQPILLGSYKSDQNEKISFCYIKQGENKILKDENYPKPTKVLVNGKNLSDWTECRKWNKIIVNDFSNSVPF